MLDGWSRQLLNWLRARRFLETLPAHLIGKGLKPVELTGIDETRRNLVTRKTVKYIGSASMIHETLEKKETRVCVYFIVRMNTTTFALRISFSKYNDRQNCSFESAYTSINRVGTWNSCLEEDHVQQRQTVATRSKFVPRRWNRILQRRQGHSLYLSFRCLYYFFPKENTFL